MVCLRQEVVVEDKLKFALDKSSRHLQLKSGERTQLRFSRACM
jgi:hypothetical protein